MKLYRVAFYDSQSGHCGYKFFGSKRFADRASRRWTKDHKGDNLSNAPVTSLFIAPSRAGLIKAFNDYGGHPNNG